jgi:sRNA-binding regulator protein Hfq
MASSDTAARRATDADLIGNRKLIRPSLSDLREQISKSAPQPHPAPAPHRLPKKSVPPEQTNAENFYYVKQMQSKTPMVLVLQDGERIRGVIEWYDRHCLKIHRAHEPNLLIYKSNIKYLYKAEDEHMARSAGRGE